MRIDPKEQIADWPALKVRHLFRRAIRGRVHRPLVESVLGVSAEEAQQVLGSLVDLGYLEPPKGGDELSWECTHKGNALACATAALRVSRRTAESHLRQFLERAATVNRNQELAYRVSRVAVFGSFLTDTDQLGDVDVALDLRKRLDDPRLQAELEDARRDHARARGRSFQHFMEGFHWPSREVMMFLKSRSRVISIHDFDDPVDLRATYRVVFEDGGV